MSSVNDELAEKFIDAWGRYDIVAIRELFNDDFEYVVNGVKRFDSKYKLQFFWGFNRVRQLEIKISHFPSFSALNRREDIYVFHAEFYNLGRGMKTNVFGEFEIKSENGRISSIKENYHKNENYSFTYSSGVFYRKIIKPVFEAANKLLTLIGFLAKQISGFISIILYIMILAALVFNRIFGFSELNFLPLSNENMDIVLMAMAGVVLFLNQIVPNIKLSGSDIVVKELKSHNEDLKIIYTNALNAEKVAILSGDYSFFDNYQPLEDLLLQMAGEGRLELFSYKDESVVENAMMSRTKSFEILNALQEASNIYFNSGLKKKFTVITHGDHMTLLFRWREINGDGQKKEMIGIMNPKGRNVQVLKIIEEMLEYIRLNSPYRT